MTTPDLEALFYRPAPVSAEEQASRRRESSAKFRPPPVRADRAPYRLALASICPARARAVEGAGRIVFHVVGDTGGVNGVGAQQNVADHVTRQVHETKMPDQPSFF